jgi:hypothetical protein
MYLSPAGRLGKTAELLVFSGMLAAAPKAVAQCPAPMPIRQEAPAVRSMQDRGTGRHWLLVRQGQRRGGPGELISWAGQPPADGAATTASAAPLPQLIIRGGDRVLLTDCGVAGDAVFEAVALEPASLGRTFHVRITLFGNSVLAVALAPGHAVLAPGLGARP